MKRSALLATCIIVFASPAFAQRRKPPPTSPDGQKPMMPGSLTQMGDPTVPIPEEPLKISPELKARIGTDWDGRYTAPLEDTIEKRYFPYYEERRADYRLRLLPPFYLEHTRGLPHANTIGRYNAPTSPDRESLYGLLYYQRRSLDKDADVLFPLAWRFRNQKEHSFGIGPYVGRRAPGERDDWLMPFVFSGSRQDGGGYFHAPFALTFSHHSPESAFALVGPYFRKRTGTEVDLGVAPFFFHGEMVTTAGTYRNYTLIPPLAFYHRESELEDTSTSVVGPFVFERTPKRTIFDIAPLFFHLRGRPEASGVEESHTTLFPFFHYGKSPEERLLLTPLFGLRTTPSTTTVMTPLYSMSTTRNGSTRLDLAGPIVPLFFNYRDRDIDLSRWGLLPLAYHSTSPTHNDWFTPIFARFEERGVSTSTWIFPTFVRGTHKDGWHTDFYPLLFTGRDKTSSHAVVAPLFWRFADTADDSVTQVVLNTLYIRKQVAGGTDWQFHLLPLLSFGAAPEGHFWNILFGLAGYQRSGEYSRIKAFWIPIQVGGPSAQHTARR